MAAALNDRKMAHLPSSASTGASLNAGQPMNGFSGKAEKGRPSRPPRRRRVDDSLMVTLRRWTVDHQIGISINLVFLLLLTHICFPRARTQTRKFIELSYYDPSSGKYTQGYDDLYFVALWIVIFTGLRVAIMEYICVPLAELAGITKQRTKVRFAEQAWLFIYYAVFWTLGMYIMYNTKYWMNLRELWTDFPTRTMTGLLKWYYLVQFAFWVQQIVVVNIEERRKDHWQMFTHHIVTCFLISMSYAYYQTKVGNAILCVMDVVDLFLPAAKLLKYSGFQTSCDCAFALFVVTWFLARHVCYLMICWSLHAHVPTLMPAGCYSSVTGKQLSTDGGNDIASNVFQSFTTPGGPVCFNEKTRLVFLSLLLFLQGITLMWFAMIVRVAYKVVLGQGADDSRSDDEGEEEDLQDEDDVDGEISARHEATSALPIEHTVGVEEVHLPHRVSVRHRKSNGHAGPLSLAAADHKELLGRIGCDKPS